MKKNLYIGGYSILDLADANVYAQALICAKQNKPVLVYDDPLRYYADTIAIDTDNDDNVVITKGGKTITITDANSVSSEGDITIKQVHQYQITLELDNSGSMLELKFVHTTLNDFEDVTNGTLTVEIANTIVKDYNNIIMFDVSNNLVAMADNWPHIDEDGNIDMRLSGDTSITASIVSDSKYSIKKLF